MIVFLHQLDIDLIDKNIRNIIDKMSNIHIYTKFRYWFFINLK